MAPRLEIRTHRGGWAVFGHWFGEMRPVYGGPGTSIYECLRWKEQTPMSEKGDDDDE